MLSLFMKYRFAGIFCKQIKATEGGNVKILKGQKIVAISESRKHPRAVTHGRMGYVLEPRPYPCYQIHKRIANNYYLRRGNEKMHNNDL